MAYAMPMPVPARVRPVQVTVATYLMYAVAGAEALMALLALATLGAVRDAYEEAMGAPSAGTVAVVIGMVFNVIALGIFATLGLLIGKGKNAARIITWCVVGPAPLCFASQLVRGSSTRVRIGDANRAEPSRVDAIVAEHLPGWATAGVLVLTIVGFAAAVTVIVLLALPQANAYFRKPPVMVPAMPFPVPPGYPPRYPPPQGWPRQR